VQAASLPWHRLVVDARCAGRCSWHDGRRTTSRRVGPPPEGRRSSGGQASLSQVRRPLSPRRIRRVDSAVGAEQIRVSDAPSVKRLARKKPPPKNGNSKLWANEVATRLRACESPPATTPRRRLTRVRTRGARQRDARNLVVERLLWAGRHSISTGVGRASCS